MPQCDLGGCWRPWLAASCQLIKPLTRGHHARRHTPHLFHNTWTQSHTLVRGKLQVWQPGMCTCPLLHVHKHTSSSSHDLPELQLTHSGSLHRTTSHLDAYWQLDQTIGSWLTREGEKRRGKKGQIWKKLFKKGKQKSREWNKIIKTTLGTKKNRLILSWWQRIFSHYYRVGVERVLSAKLVKEFSQSTIEHLRTEKRTVSFTLQTPLKGYFSLL